MRPATSSPLAALAAALTLASSLAAQPGTHPPQQPAAGRQMLVFRGADNQAIEIVSGLEARGFLGVNLLDLTPELRRHFGVPEDRGVLVSRVLEGSPAARGGLLPGDILLATDGDAVSSSLGLSQRIATAAPDQPVDLAYRRGDREGSVRIRLEVRERPQFDLAPLVQRRIEVKTPRIIRLHGGQESTESEVEWIGNLVGELDDSMSQAGFLHQLEALREERSTLQEQIERLEERLGKLEAELHALDD
jgi:membrane-associated protease RseP (regulator of RpoE activity)